METEVKDDIAAFARASLKVAGHLLSDIPEQGQRVIDEALRGGAKLALQFGPLPEFQAVELLLIEAEGKRHRLTSFALNFSKAQQ